MRKFLLALFAAATLAGAAACGNDPVAPQPDFGPRFGNGFLGSGGFVDTTTVRPGNDGVQGDPTPAGGGTVLAL